MDSTAALLEKIREGDAEAQDQLVRRYLPRLQQWASGRLPARTRDLFDTDDLAPRIESTRRTDTVRLFGLAAITAFGKAWR